MANTGTDDHHEDSSSLLSKQVEEDGSKGSYNDKGNQPTKGKADAAPHLPDLSVEVGYGCSTEGQPLGHGNVVGEPMARGQWGSSLFDCLGCDSEFCCSDLEVCILGYAAPCVLSGSNVERLASGSQTSANQRLISGPQTFANHCLLDCGLCLVGEYLCQCNWLAPCFAYENRTALRQKFNLEGGCEALNSSCGCCGSCLEDEEQREHWESTCDLAIHVFCHHCALCQEGREIRRRIPHPGFNAQPLLGMIPPGEQTMGRRA
ncbi:hypothetical protein SLA2020_418680 [Shorea laevis]